MILVHKPPGTTQFSLFQLPASELDPFDFMNIMHNHHQHAQNRNLYVQFENETVLLAKEDFDCVAVYLSIYHNNTVRKNNEVRDKNTPASKTFI